jgi:hypothetical protein
MHVLVHLEGLDYGSPPFLYLMSHLSTKFQFTLVSADPKLEAICQEKGWGFGLVPQPSIVRKAWLSKVPWFGKRVTEALSEYQLQKFYGQVAKQIHQKFRPDALIIAGDYKGLGFHLCGVRPTIIPQITISWLDIDESVDQIYIVQGRNGKIVRQLIQSLSWIPGFRWPAYFGGRIYLPDGAQLWITLAAWLGGLRYKAPVKGATAADYLCVNGSFFVENHIKAGVPAEKIRVTGGPNHDIQVEKVASLSPQTEAAFRSQWGIPANARIITFFLQPLEDHVTVNYADEVAELISGLAEMPDVWIVAKFHPIQYRYKVREVHEKLADVKCLTLIEAEAGLSDDFNIELTAYSSLVITPSSTTGMFALALEKPLLTYSFHKQLADHYYLKIGGSRHVTNPKDFQSAARVLLLDPTARESLVQEQRTVRDAHMILDGHCCDRIGEVIVGAVEEIQQEA